ncbi:MAG: alkaline phosphatase D family protein [Sphingomonas sp.]|nr:alkaline phosphatase D family protein [Sphingomonas sp.]
MDRRHFLAMAASLGATLAWHGETFAAIARSWRERRESYPQGVASGDPDDTSVLLWTRRPFAAGTRHDLTVEVARDSDFRSIVAATRTPVLAESDWTTRVLVAGLRPRTVYWYRFTDDEGNGSRIGRTITAPRTDDDAPVRFAFVSCQSVNEGAQNAYRRMIWEDQHSPRDQQLGFVLHLGDFIYEVVEYPDEIAHRYDRTVFDIGRVPDARKVGNFHVPTTLDGYRMVYRAHIDDPDIQDARAHFPFVCIGDNHEFSWQGWQSFVNFTGKNEPAQALRVAANQAWWEYIPARVRKASGAGLDRFDPPAVVTTPITSFDAAGFGDEPNNAKAIDSMIAHRAVRYGRHVEILLTDHHSYAMEDPTGRPGAEDFTIKDFPFLFSEDALRTLDAGKAANDGRPAETIAFDGKQIANFRRDEPPFTALGTQQKAWLKSRLTRSTATWKIWGATNGTLDMRADPQNLPAGLTRPWLSSGFATFGGGDFSAALHERADIYDTVRDAAVDGFVIVSGDRHSFWAGYAAKALPPARFEPVGIAFITGSLSAPGLAEALEHGLKNHPLRPVYTIERPDGRKEATLNLTLKHGVRSALEYARSGDIARARALSNPDNAPHVEFVDMAGHGYSVVTAGARRIDTEFVCVPRPITRATTPDGGPIRYRVVHSAERWKPGARPQLTTTIVEGDAALSI